MATLDVARDEIVPVVAVSLGSWRLSLDRRAMPTVRLRRTYDRLANGWGDMIRRLGQNTAYRACFGGLAALADIRQRVCVPEVLDCGIGAGDFALALADAWDGQVRISGIDISPNMIAVACSRLDAAGVAGDLSAGDVRCLPFVDNAFDVVMAAHLLEHFADPTIALAEMNRVLKPGGIIVLALTRRSMAGFLIHLRWRARMLSAATAEDEILAAGFGDVAQVQAFGAPRFGRMSIALVARKARPVPAMDRAA